MAYAFLARVLRIARASLGPYAGVLIWYNTEAVEVTAIHAQARRVRTTSPEGGQGACNA